MFLQGAASGGGQAIFGARQTALERFRAADVLRVFELPRMDAEVAVGRSQQILQVVEREPLADGERADDAEAKPFVNEPVELERIALRPLRRVNGRLRSAGLGPATLDWRLPAGDWRLPAGDWRLPAID